MTANAIIEEMAKALALEIFFAPWEEVTEKIRDMCRRYARAAYEAEHEEDGK